MESKAPLKEQERNKIQVSNKNNKYHHLRQFFNERTRKVSLPQI